MPPWHLYLKITAFVVLAAFGLWLLEDFWLWLLVVAVIWQARTQRSSPPDPPSITFTQTPSSFP